MEKVKVQKYFERMGLEMPENIVPDSKLFRELQFAHCTHIPYENLNIRRGIALPITDDGLYEKIVKEKMGGICTELNGAFAWLLRQLGYMVTEYAARYLRGENGIPMRRHRVLKVEATDGTWIGDVGIGEVCPRYPVELVEGREQPQFDEVYRLDRDENLGWVLMDKHKGEWRAFYSFTEEPWLPQDFDMMTCYCEKHPASPFNKDEMFAIKTATGRKTLDGHIYKEFNGNDVTVKELSDAEMPWAYAQFGLKF